jgi:hypothetical protein
VPWCQANEGVAVSQWHQRRSTATLFDSDVNLCLGAGMCVCPRFQNVFLTDINNELPSKVSLGAGGCL